MNELTLSLPDGEVMTFPEGTSNEEMEQAARTRWQRKMFAKKHQSSLSPAQMQQQSLAGLAKEQGPVDAFTIGAGQGLMSVGRGIGNLLAPGKPFGADEAEQQSMAALHEARPWSTGAGQIVGEAAPFAALPIGAAGTTVKGIGGLAKRGLVGLAAGGLEGLIVSKGQGLTGEEQAKATGMGGAMGGGAEVMLPGMYRVTAKLAKAIYKAVKGIPTRKALLDAAGQPTQQLTELLTEIDMPFDELTERAKEVFTDLPSEISAEGTARAARFEEAGMPYTRGDVTQETVQQGVEEGLVRSITDPVAEPLRDLRIDQSHRFDEILQELSPRKGIPDELGANMKDALSGRKILLREQRNELYDEFFKRSDSPLKIPFPLDNMRDAILPARKISRLAKRDAQAQDVMDLLAEYGIDNSDEAAQRLIDGKIEPQTLTLENFDDFRQDLNSMMEGINGKRAQVIGLPIKEALDVDSLDLADIATKAGITDKNVLEPLVQARGLHKQLMTEFSPESITGKLINTKRDGVTPVVEASRIYKTIVGPGKADEMVERTVDSLMKAGDEGMQAMEDLQAATIMNLLEDAHKAKTRKIKGQSIFGTVAFNKALDKIDGRQLKAIFRNNPEGYRELKRISKIADDLTPAGDLVPKGSAQVNQTLMAKLNENLSKIPRIGRYFRGMNEFGAAGDTAKDVGHAILTRNNQQGKLARQISRQFPSMAVAFGIPFYMEDVEDEENEE